MSKYGEVILIEDDLDDRELFISIYEDLNYSNKLRVFADPVEALNYLKQPDVHPFMVVSDINMPKLGGFELRERIFNDEQLSLKCFPYIFLTTSYDEKTVEKAFKLSIQGYFQKESTYSGYKEKFRSIMEYWQNGLIPKKALT